MIKCDFCGSTSHPVFASSLGGYICSNCLKQGRDPDTYRNHQKTPRRSSKNN